MVKGTVINLFERLSFFVFKPVHSAPLGIFRWVFGCVMAFQFYVWYHEVPRFVENIKIRFTYDFFHWVDPLPPQHMSLFLLAMTIVSLLFAFGWLYRFLSVILFAGTLYVFLLEQTLYNNHYYLEILIAFLMIFINANSFAVLGKKEKVPFVPNWQMILLQFQFFVVYFYGGIAKINPEWLFDAQPVKEWLPEMLPTLYPSLGQFQIKFIAYSIAYFGLVFDLVIGFLLLFAATRKWALLLLLLFHVSNSLMFTIGVFPWFALGATVLFFPTAEIPFIGKRSKWVIPDLSFSRAKRTAVLLFLSCWVLIQCLVPLRHWLIPGWVLWDERGYKFSWFMKLRAKTPLAAIRIKFEGDVKDYYIEPEFYISKKQAQSSVYKPLEMVQFAHKIEDYIHGLGEERDVKIYAELYCQLHEHPMQLIIDPEYDLTQIAYKNQIYFGQYPWIKEFDPDATPIDFEFLKSFRDSTGVYR